MNLEEIIDICRGGKTGIIPGWVGYLDWDYADDQLVFHNNEYKLKGKQLLDNIQDRNDLYYII